MELQPRSQETRAGSLPPSDDEGEAEGSASLTAQNGQSSTMGLMPPSESSESEGDGEGEGSGHASEQGYS